MNVLMFVLILLVTLALNHSFVSPRLLSKPRLTVRKQLNQQELTVEEWRDDLDQVISSFTVNNGNNTSFITLTPSSSNLKRIIRGIGSFALLLRQTFLPTGFPYSVPNEYLHFQAWNLLQDLCSYLRGIMSTRAILLGMGVGRADVTAVQATVQWIVRDGASLIGGLLFTAFNSYDFGQNIKQWRLFADMINNVGITLNMLAPLSPKLFLPLLCLGSVCTTLCGIAAGSTNAAINTHWGQSNNIADVLAKNNAQHNIISLLGLLVSIPFAHFAETVQPHIMWIIYSCLTCIHIGSNYRALRILTLKSINNSRYQLLLSRYLAMPAIARIIHSFDTTGISSAEEVNDGESTSDSRLLSPTAIARAEPIVRLFFPSSSSSQDVAINKWTRLYPSAVSKLSAEKMYTISISRRRRSSMSKGSSVIDLSFQHKSTFADHAKGYFEAEILRSLLLSSHTTSSDSSIDDWQEVREQRAEQLTNTLFPQFLSQLKGLGWKEDISNLKPAGASTYRIQGGNVNKQ